jgi:hypothetical protein
VLFAATGATAEANNYRQDWNCPGNPYAWCWTGQYHTYSTATAVNTINSYWKCSKLERDGYIYAQTCAYGNYVRVESDDWNQLPYPNTATYLGALVSNQTSVHHGLRGVAWY